MPPRLGQQYDFVGDALQLVELVSNYGYPGQARPNADRLLSALFEYSAKKDVDDKYSALAFQLVLLPGVPVTLLKVYSVCLRGVAGEDPNVTRGVATGTGALLPSSNSAGTVTSGGTRSRVGSSSRGTGARPPARAAASAPTVTDLRVWAAALQNCGFLLGEAIWAAARSLHVKDTPAGPELDILLHMVAALLHADAFSAASRLLLAEEQRGSKAVYEPIHMPFVLRPLTRVCWLLGDVRADLRLPPLRDSTGQQQQQWRTSGGATNSPPPPVMCAVLEALSSSSFLENLARFALRKLVIANVGPKCPAFAIILCLDDFLEALDKAHRATVSAGAPETGALVAGPWPAAVRDGLAAVLTPGVQYFLAAVMVSQLHAYDGGTLYGMPHSQLLQPQLVKEADHRRTVTDTGVPSVRGIMAVCDMWVTCSQVRLTNQLQSQPLPLPPLGPRSQVAMCVRAARVLVEPLRTATAGGSAAAAAGHGGGNKGGSGSSSGSSSGTGVGAMITTTLLTREEQTLKAVTVLGSAAKLMDCTEWEQSGGGAAGGGGIGGGGGGEGAERGGGGGGTIGAAVEERPTRAPAGSALSIIDIEAAEKAEAEKAARRWTWLRRGAFAREWWPLVVPAVHAQMESPLKAVEITWLWQLLQPPTYGLKDQSTDALPTVLPPRPPPWLAAALSAGYLPCIERFYRSVMTTGPLGPPVQRVAILQAFGITLLPGPVLVQLLAYGKERQAAALLCTMTKLAAAVVAKMKETPAGMLVRTADDYEYTMGGFVEAMQLLLSRAKAAYGVDGGGGAASASASSSSNGGGGGSGPGPSSLPAAASAAVEGPSPHGPGTRAYDPNRQLIRLFSLVIPRLMPICQTAEKVLKELHLPQQSPPPESQQQHPARLIVNARTQITRITNIGTGAVMLGLQARSRARARGDSRAEQSWSGLLAGTAASWDGPSGSEGDAAQELLPPCDAAQVLPVCGNPRCAVFEGHSEAGRPQRRCGGKCGGAVAYCCAGCQREHWEAGHREECGKRG